MPKFGSFGSPPSRYLDGCDAWLDEQFERGNEIGHQFGSVTMDPDQQHWSRWRPFTTKLGNLIYIHPLVELPAEQLLTLLTAGGTRSWSFVGFTKDRAVIMVMQGPSRSPLVYALSSAVVPEHHPWKFPGLTTEIIIAWIYFFIFAAMVIYNTP